jgi:polyketide biosynthesis enoyl-CoA hydratase PksI
MSRLVHLSRAGDGILVLALEDREGRNAFRDPLVEELVRGLAEAGADPGARVLVLRGLPEIFCAGASEELLLELADGKMAPSDIVLTKAVLDFPLPTIAAMEGHAVGGGLALGLACDLVLLARESRYGCTFMNLGFTPGMGTTRLLAEAVGPYLAAEMMYGGELLRGSRLEGRAVVNRVLPRAEILPRALELAARIAEKPRPALLALKRWLSLPRRRAFEETRTVEALLHELCFARPETAARIREAYVRPATEGGGGETP